MLFEGAEETQDHTLLVFCYDKISLGGGYYTTMNIRLIQVVACHEPFVLVGHLDVNLGSSTSGC